MMSPFFTDRVFFILYVAVIMLSVIGEHCVWSKPVFGGLIEAFDGVVDPFAKAFGGIAEPFIKPFIGDR